MSSSVGAASLGRFREVWNQLVTKQRILFDAHEDYGRRNITRAVLGTYFAGYLWLKARGNRKHKLELEEKRAKHRAAGHLDH
ncbi:hypothetical protein AAVH_12214 [Aphelenchoides avenae]|nr:hypothetical protein AAVH_12214 [Aphelenchus avenae]